MEYALGGDILGTGHFQLPSIHRAFLHQGIIPRRVLLPGRRREKMEGGGIHSGVYNPAFDLNVSDVNGPVLYFLPFSVV